MVGKERTPCARLFFFLFLAEVLECQASWKDGTSHFLVGKMNHTHASSDEDRFRCFVYELINPLLPSQGLWMAESGDATCNGLYSPREGPRTLKLWRGAFKCCHSYDDCSFDAALGDRRLGPCVMTVCPPPAGSTQTGCSLPSRLLSHRWLSLDGSLGVSFSNASQMSLVHMHGTGHKQRRQSEATCHTTEGDKIILYQKDGW